MPTYTSTTFKTTREQRLISREWFACSRAKNHYKVPIGDRAALRDFYLACPEGHEVDHIVPFWAGGSHDVANLQYLTRTANNAKTKEDIKKYGKWKRPSVDGLTGGNRTHI